MNTEVANIRKNITINDAIGESESSKLRANATATTVYAF
jgi:hypothetical protein